MEQGNVEANFHEIELRPERSKITEPDTVRPHSTSKIHQIWNSALRKTFKSKKRRFTTSATEIELVKNSISAPANCSRVRISEEDFQFSRSSIQCCPFDISGYGIFLLMDEFKAQKPRKMVMVVFLFEKIIIFTKKQPTEEIFYYIGSVKLDQVALVPPNTKNKKLLEIKDHLSSVRFHKETIFSLEAPSEYIQLQWRKAIEKCLWSQLMKAKRDGGLGRS